LRGDRTDLAQIAQLAARGGWDVVIDASGYTPDVVALTDDSALYDDGEECTGPLPGVLAATAEYGRLKAGCTSGNIPGAAKDGDTTATRSPV
jgi:hypothetical protein